MPLFFKAIRRPKGDNVEVEFFGDILTYTVTAEQIAESWDEDYLLGSFLIDGVSSGKIVEFVWVEKNTLDQGIDINDFVVYSPNASTVDISDNGQHLDGAIGGVENETDYAYSVHHTSSFLAVIKKGAQAYLLFGGDAAPTEGIMIFKVLVNCK
jgi:hypothetical protein